MDQPTYTRLAEYSPAILAAFNETHLRWVNAAFTRHLGWSVDAARAVQLRDLQHPDDLQQFDRAVAAAFTSAPPMTARTRMQHRDGTYRLIDWFVAPMAQGLFYARDVERQMQVEQLLDQRVGLLHKAEELAGLGSWSVDVKSGIQTWSPQVFRIYGLPPSDTAPSLEDALGAYHPDDRARVSELVADAAMRGASFEFDLRLIRADGEVRSVYSSGHCVTNALTGDTETIFGTFLDVTDRDRARDKRAHEQRLMTMGMLAVGVGHEMNNPLTFVSANVEAAIEELELIAGPVPSGHLHTLLELLSDARTGTERLRRVVRGLRAFARVDGPTAPTTVRDVIDAAVALSMHEIRDRATCEVLVDDVPLVHADESRLSQVLVNLICNAAQAFPTQDPSRNRIVVRATLAGTDSVAVSVSDNGAGMTPEVARQIFEPFYTTKAAGVGMGLGLAISQSIVESFGSTLECRTELGAGTTFTMHLPVSHLQEAVPAAPPMEQAVPPAAPSAPVAGRRGQVVIVDDEAVLLRALERLLGSSCHVKGFTDAREALAYLRDVDEVDVILCDVMMPHLNGQELYESLRHTRPELLERFLFMTGGATHDHLRMFLTGLTREFIAKPFDTRQLRTQVRELIDERTSRL